MTAIITAALASVWPYLLAALGGLVLILQQRRAGANAERAKQAERDKKARDIADQVDNDVGAMPPGGAKKGLGKWSKS